MRRFEVFDKFRRQLQVEHYQATSGSHQVVAFMGIGLEDLAE
jgi:hypothetical protein